MILRSTRVLTDTGMRPATVHLRKDIISRIGDFAEHPDIDVGDDVVMPGLIDTHVHVNEPGRTHWEGFAAATRVRVH